MLGKSKLVLSLFLVVLVLSSGVYGETVLLDDDFSTLDLTSWNVVKQAATTVSVANGELRVDIPGEAPVGAVWRYQGLISQQAFQIQSGQTMVVDYYGINDNNSSSSISLPGVFLTADYPTPEDINDLGSITEGGFTAGIRGGCLDLSWNNYWRSPEGAGLMDPYIYMGTQHYVMTVTESEFNIYIEPTFAIEDLETLTPDYTMAIPAGALDNGLYLFVGVALSRAYIRDMYEEFDGVTVTMLESTLLAGDANRDGVVSAGDYASVQSNFGNTGAPGIPGDANGDGVVSADDYASVQSNFGNTAASAGAVPEPASFSLISLGVLTIIRRKKA